MSMDREEIKRKLTSFKEFLAKFKEHIAAKDLDLAMGAAQTLIFKGNELLDVLSSGRFQQDEGVLSEIRSLLREFYSLQGSLSSMLATTA